MMEKPGGKNALRSSLIQLTKSSEVEAESEDPGEYLSISLAEIAGVVKKIPSSKAPGVDESCPEMLKALDIVGLSWYLRVWFTSDGKWSVTWSGSLVRCQKYCRSCVRPSW